METLFRRHFWVFHVVFLALVAFLVASASGSIVNHMLKGSFSASDATKASGPTRESRNVRTRSFDVANDANIFGAKRELVTEENTASAAASCTTNDDCETGFCQDGICSSDDDTPPGERDNAVKSELRVRLVGTAVFDDPEQSLASIVDAGSGKKGKADLYSIKECEPLPPAPAVEEGEDAPPSPPRPPCNRLMEVAEVRDIQADHVYLYNESEKRWEYLLMGDEPEGAPSNARTSKKKSRSKKPKLGEGITKNSATSYSVKQDEVDKALSNLSSLATQARIVPAFEGGEAVGFKLFSIRPNSLYSKIGIQNGDVITRINGYEINSPDKALEVYQKLKDSKSINVDLKRRGKPVTLDYAITP